MFVMWNVLLAMMWSLLCYLVGTLVEVDEHKKKSAGIVYFIGGWVSVFLVFSLFTNGYQGFDYP